MERSRAEIRTYEAAEHLINTKEADILYEGDWGSRDYPDDLLSALEYFIAELVALENHDFREGLDGVEPAYVRRSGERQIEVVGSAILIDDQTLTPVYVRLELTTAGDNKAGFRRVLCCLGEKDPESSLMIRSPCTEETVWRHRDSVAKRLDEIEWVYIVDREMKPWSIGNTELYSLVGPEELKLIEASGWKRFPSRLPEQPMFYPVLNLEYARQIARDWNIKESKAGFVIHFFVRTDFLDRYEVQQVGEKQQLEYWIPAEDLDDFNDYLVGVIEVVERYEKGE